MSRYTPKRLPAAKGGGPARPTSPARRAKPGAAKKSTKKKGPPGTFVCATCERRFRTEEALATHARDAHGQPIDLKKLSPVAPNMVRCPLCAAPVRKRNLEQHLRFIHDTV